MKLNTQQQLKTLKGDPLKTSESICQFCGRGDTKGEVLILGTILSNIVLAPHKDKNGFRPLRAYELAQKFVNQKVVEIENSDLIQIKELVEKTEGTSALVIAQTLLMLESAKEK